MSSILSKRKDGKKREDEVFATASKLLFPASASTNHNNLYQNKGYIIKEKILTTPLEGVKVK